MRFGPVSGAESVWSGAPFLTLTAKRLKTLQKFSSVHASVHNHLNQDRHLISRDDFKAQRSAALAEWRSLAS